MDKAEIRRQLAASTSRPDWQPLQTLGLLLSQLCRLTVVCRPSSSSCRCRRCTYVGLPPGLLPGYARYYRSPCWRETPSAPSPSKKAHIQHLSLDSTYRRRRCKAGFDCKSVSSRAATGRQRLHCIRLQSQSPAALSADPQL